MPRRATTKKSTSDTKPKKAPKAEPEEKKIGLFDVLDMIAGAKTPWEELSDDYKAAYSQFMINRFIASVDYLLPIVEHLSCMKGLTNEQHYLMLTSAIPPGRKLWFNYKMFKKEKTDKDEEFYVWAMSREYEIGLREARTYINNLDNTEKAQLKDKWEEIYKNK